MYERGIIFDDPRFVHYRIGHKSPAQLNKITWAFVVLTTSKPIAKAQLEKKSFFRLQKGLNYYFLLKKLFNP